MVKVLDVEGRKVEVGDVPELREVPSSRSSFLKVFEKSNDPWRSYKNQKTHEKKD